MKYLYFAILLTLGCNAPEQKPGSVSGNESSVPTAQESPLKLIHHLIQPKTHKVRDPRKHIEFYYPQQLVPVKSNGFVFNYTVYKEAQPYIQPVFTTNQNKLIYLPLIEAETDFRDICDAERYEPTRNRYLANDRFIYEFVLDDQSRIMVTRIDLTHSSNKPIRRVSVNTVKEQIGSLFNQSAPFYVTRLEAVRLEKDVAIVHTRCFQIVHHRFAGAYSIPVIINLKTLSIKPVLAGSFPKITIDYKDMEVEYKDRYKNDFTNKWDYQSTIDGISYYTQKTTKVENKKISQTDWFVCGINTTGKIVSNRRFTIQSDSFNLLHYSLGSDSYSQIDVMNFRCKVERSSHSYLEFDADSKCFYIVNLCQSKPSGNSNILHTEKIGTDGTILWKRDIDLNALPFGKQYHCRGVSIEKDSTFSIYFSEYGTRNITEYVARIHSGNGSLIDAGKKRGEHTSYGKMESAVSHMLHADTTLTYLSGEDVSHSYLRMAEHDYFIILRSPPEDNYYIYRYR